MQALVGNSNASSFDVKKILSFLFGSFVFYRVMKMLIKFYKYQSHRADLIKKLPGPELGKHESFLGHLNGGLILDRGAHYNQDIILDKVTEGIIKISGNAELNGGNKGLFRIYGIPSFIPLNTLAVIVVTDIDFVRQILSAKNAACFEKGFAYQSAHELIGDGILSTSGEKWAVQRPVLEKAMKHDVLSKMMPKIIQTANEFVNKLKNMKTNRRVIDVHEEMLKLTVDVIGRVAFGYEFDSVKKEKTSDALLYNAFDNIIITLAKRVSEPTWPVTRLLPLEKNRIFYESMGKLDTAVNNVLDSRIKLRAEEAKFGPNDAGKKHNTDLCDILLDAIESGDMKRETAKDNIKTLLFAGHDTTAAALSWMIHLLSEHPEAAQKIRDEANRIIGTDKDAYPTYEQLESMDYLNACMLEVFRLYPSAGFTRNTVTDFQLGDITLPANVEILVLPYVIQRDPRNYPDRPNEFVPERWLEGGSEAQYLTSDSSSKAKGEAQSESVGNRQDSVQSKIGRYGMNRPFLPFSLGQRNCVGRPLSLAEIRTTILIILRNFNLVSLKVRGETNPDFRAIPKLTLTMNPVSIKVEFEPI